VQQLTIGRAKRREKRAGRPAFDQTSLAIGIGDISPQDKKEKDRKPPGNCI
jgi:hypothetical protein